MNSVLDRMTREKKEEQGLEPYFAHIRRLPFIRKITLREVSSIGDPNSKVLRLVTPQGPQDAFLIWLRSHPSQEVVDYVVHLEKQRDAPYFLFAPSVGREASKRLTEARINYMDLAGNCSVRLGDDYIAQIEGRRLPQKTPRQRALRVPSLQVLFTLLEGPELAGAPLRTIAEAAGGTSPQTVSDLRKRLVAEDWVTAAGRVYAWAPQGKERALDLLLTDYGSLAAHLQLARFRARPGALSELEDAIAAELKGQRWSFGGGAALDRKNGYYRGRQTVVYLEGAVPSMPKMLVPDERGEVIFSRFPSKRADDDERGISSLLIYLDLMTEGEPRAVEAAAELRAELFGGDSHDS